MTPTGLLGGSFNPAHSGHRRISLAALDALGLDEVWWLVSPGNPLKSAAPDMAPFPVRVASARVAARRARIRVTGIERELGTRYTVDTLRRLVARYPHRRFVWLMGADNLAEFHRWHDWRRIARMLPIAVIGRPGYNCHSRATRATGWLSRFVHPRYRSRQWTQWSTPAILLLRLPPDTSSATALRAADPAWADCSRDRSFARHADRDMVTHRSLS